MNISITKQEIQTLDKIYNQVLLDESLPQSDIDLLKGIIIKYDKAVQAKIAKQMIR